MTDDRRASQYTILCLWYGLEATATPSEVEEADDAAAAD